MALHGHAQARWSITREAASFDRAALANPADAQKIRAGGTLGGREGDWGITGFLEYDFDVPLSGWYELEVLGRGEEVTYRFDPDKPDAYRSLHTFYGTDGATSKRDKAGNTWLEKGRHTLRIERHFWTGFPRISGFVISLAADDLGHRLRIVLANPPGPFRSGQCPVLHVYTGARSEAAALTLWVKDQAEAIKTTRTVKLPASPGLLQQEVSLPCDQTGAFRAWFGEGGRGFSARDAFPVSYEIVDVTKRAAGTGPLQKSLVEEIDCTRTAPDYEAGGNSRVVNASFGSYRESGDNGFTHYQRANDTVRRALPPPSWFAYKLNRLHPQTPYLVEIEYPDDAARTYVVALRESMPLAYPVSTAIDSGGEFSRSDRLLTRRILFWPRGDDARIVFENVHNGRRAAVSRIRVYEVSDELPALTNTPARRHFVNWFEEGRNFLSVYGAADEYDKGINTAAARWFSSARLAGVDTIIPAVVVYDFALYPSVFNLAFSSPQQDVLRRLLLLGEKYGLGVLPELHPRADELSWPSDAAPENSPALLASRSGRTSYFTADGKTRNRPPFYNPLYPPNKSWYLGMIGELLDRYKDSSALKGVSLRLMPWANATLNNFQSLDWGYDDYTINLFKKETGTEFAGAGNSPNGVLTPQIAQARYDWLMKHAKDQWIQWRCSKIAALVETIRDRVRATRPDLALYLNVFTWDRDRDNQTAALREAGIDMQLLNRIDGIVIVNAMYTYGTREADPVWVQTNRDFLLNPVALRLTGVGPRAFMPTASYIEATEVVAPPTALGLPPATKATWSSSAAYPAGRHAQERYAVMLAETDANWLGDGGNGYTLEPFLLDSFVREYRTLPAEKFTPRPDARDPAAVWFLASAKQFTFYAVNRERYPVRVEISLAGPQVIRRLSTGDVVSARAGVFTLSLEPYELQAYEAPAGARIVRVEQAIPASELKRVSQQVTWLNDFAERFKRPLTSLVTSETERRTVSAAAADAASALQHRRYWSARTIVERAELVKLYVRLGVFPPDFRNTVVNPAEAPPEPKN